MVLRAGAGAGWLRTRVVIDGDRSTFTLGTPALALEVDLVWTVAGPVHLSLVGGVHPYLDTELPPQFDRVDREPARYALGATLGLGLSL